MLVGTLLPPAAARTSARRVHTAVSLGDTVAAHGSTFMPVTGSTQR
ncbi:MAG: hypothetical protein HXX10_14465 [Rhodoplanes sp.]|nr:hypothetical protein [Rhodoplanes sp.]NVO15235.1 hypothetical protein [Rhodoplanes sp.]